MTPLPRARGRNLPGHSPGEMNGVEKAYARVLEAEKAEGSVLAYWFEAMKFSCGAKRTWWTPDFVVMRADRTLELVDVKGTRPVDEQAQRVKAKLVAARYPHRVVIARQQKGGGFRIEEVAA